jgi:hypothetical protein
MPASSPRWRRHAAIERLRIIIGAPTATVAQLLDVAMNVDLPRGKLCRPRHGASRPPSPPTPNSSTSCQLALSGMDAAIRFETYSAIAFTGAGEVRKKNPYTAEAAKAAPALADLLPDGKPRPQGSEVTRICRSSRLNPPAACSNAPPPCSASPVRCSVISNAASAPARPRL